MNLEFNFFKKKKKKFESNGDFRNHIERKKRNLILLNAYFISTLLMIGFSLSTPDYSLREIVSSRISTEFSFISYIMQNDIVKTMAMSYVSENNYNSLLKTSSTVFIYLFLIYISFHILSSRDPFSSISDFDSNKKMFFWNKDISIYSNLIPSKQLHTKCMKCNSRNICNNAISKNQAQNSKKLWAMLYGKLDIKIIEGNANLILQMRKYFLFKYIPLIIAILLLFFIYPSVRLIEYLLSIKIKYNNTGLFIFIIILIAIHAVFKIILPTKSSKSTWKKLKDNIDYMFESNNFNQNFTKYICENDPLLNHYIVKFSANRPTIYSGYQLYKILNEIFYSIDERHTIDICKDKIFPNINTLEEKINKKITALLTVLHSIINEIYKDANIRVALFTKSDNGDFLFPFMSLPMIKNESSLLHLSDNYGDFFSLINSKSLVCDSWLASKVLYENGESIKYLHDTQKNYLKSIISIPIEFQNSEKIICAICIDADKKDIFTSKTYEDDKKIILEIGKRITLELIKYKNCIKEIKDGTN